MSLPDTIFIFALALVIFGPKKLPEIGRQIGKLVFEFRRASNEFKMQIEEELRAAEQLERQKKIAAESAQETAPAINAKEAMIVRPPSTGMTVSTESPSRVVPVDEEAATLAAILPPNPAASQAAEDGLPPPAAGLSQSESAPHLEAMAETSPVLPVISAAAGAETESAAVPGSDGPGAPEAVSSADPVADSVADPVLAAGSRQEAARRAEEHIQEQIAIHHG